MSATGRIFRKCLSLPAILRALLRSNRHETGFTLFEMMVTLAILALISGIAFPRLQNLQARQIMTEARGAVALAVARAHAYAVRRDTATRVTLSQTGDQLVISGIAATPLPAGALVEWPREGLLIFGDGSSNGVKGFVRAGTSSSVFSIAPATAQIEFTP